MAVISTRRKITYSSTLLVRVLSMNTPRSPSYALCGNVVVIRTICNNPDAGLFWAGDTAQTISIGSAFRFDDLKAFLYRIEVDLLISVL